MATPGRSQEFAPSSAGVPRPAAFASSATFTYTPARLQGKRDWDSGGSRGYCHPSKYKTAICAHWERFGGLQVGGK